ncbi:metal ABC transporter permease [Halovivax cerinus]|uniref:Metal ABC transporter permease n=1 Tax=Halovivax cerinus TaxID=1487865 RepID=A0ABD5NMH6_9EURY|nr:metal ABC transporter permease [Halovivax cerinus]
MSESTQSETDAESIDDPSESRRARGDSTIGPTAHAEGRKPPTRREQTAGESTTGIGLIQRIGLAVTVAFALVLTGFVVSHWLRAYPLLGDVAAQYVYAGQHVDRLLGTNVFRHPVMWQSVATAVLIGIVAPLVGVFLVHREMALIGETLAHTAFAGVAVGLLLGATTDWQASLLLSALVVGIGGALAVQWLAEQTDAYGDVPIAIMLTGSFAVGTLVISYGRGLTAVNVEEYLFGNLAFVTGDGARLMVVLTIFVVIGIASAYKQLQFITFDEQAARVARLNVRGYNALLVVMTAVVVVGAMQVLGVILVAGMLVIPVAAATQLAESFRETVSLSILFGQAAVIGGYALAISQSLPPGGSIIVVGIACYLIAVLRGTTASPTGR